MAQRKLDMAGNPNNWTASDFLGVRGLAALGCGGIPLLLLWFGHAPLQNLIVMTLAGALLGFFLPVIWIAQKIKARQKAIQKGLPDALDLLTISVKAGLALDAGFAKVAGLRDVTCFGDLACFADLACFDELLKTSDSQPASLTSIGRSAIAAKAAMMVRRRGRNPEAILPRTQMNSRRFMLAPPEGHHSSRDRDTGRGR